MQANESVQRFACKMATHNWSANYQEHLSLINIPIPGKKETRTEAWEFIENSSQSVFLSSRPHQI